MKLNRINLNKAFVFGYIPTLYTQHFFFNMRDKNTSEKGVLYDTSDPAMLVSLDSDLCLFFPPELQQQGRSSELFVAPPGFDVC